MSCVVISFISPGLVSSIHGLESAQGPLITLASDSNRPLQLRELITRLEKNYHIVMIVSQELLNSTVHLPEEPEPLAQFIHNIARQLSCGYILLGPDADGRFHVLLSVPQIKSGSSSRSSYYQSPSHAYPGSRKKEVVPSEPIRLERPQQPQQKPQKPDKKDYVPTAGSFQLKPSGPVPSPSVKKKPEKKKP